MGPATIRLPRLGACSAPWLHAGVCALLATLLLVPSEAFAQQVDGDTATARSQVAILSPGSVAKTADMDFGSIAQSNTAGTVVLTPQNVATCTPSGTLIRTGTCRAARFSIFGRKNNKARIRETNGGVITLNGPSGATMLLDNLTIGVSGMTPFANGNGWNFGNWKINTNSGITEFWVGGTLHVAAAQTPGVYNGTLVIQIQFN
jgi:hypothetical protein